MLMVKYFLVFTGSMYCNQVEICILVVWSYSVTAQIGYDYFRPQKPFSQNDESRSQRIDYSNATVTTLPILGYSSGPFTPNIIHSLGTVTPSTNSRVTPISEYPSGTYQTPSKDGSIPDRSNVQSTFSPGQQPGFDQSIGPQRMDISQYNTTKVPQYTDQIFSQFQGSPRFPQYTAPADSSRYADIIPDVENPATEGDYSAIPGSPGEDYPIYSVIPLTSFLCEQQPYPGYYADVETDCQVFHICANNRTYDFLCPNGTIFHQEYLVCVWWNTFDCSTALSLYTINAYIYDYSIRFPQKQIDKLSTTTVDQEPGFFNNFGAASPIRTGATSDFSRVHLPSFSGLIEKGIEYNDPSKDIPTKHINDLPSDLRTSKFEDTVHSRKPEAQNFGSQSSGQQETFISTEFPGRSSQKEKALNQSIESHKLYGYPRKQQQIPKFSVPVSHALGGTRLGPSFPPRGYPNESPKSVQYTNGIAQGPVYQGYRTSSPGVPGYHVDVQGPEVPTRDAQINPYSQSKSLPQSYSGQQPSGQQPTREYLPPLKD